MPYKDRNKQREYQKNWTRKHRENQKLYVRKLRLKVIKKLGGKCVYCGCDNPEALELNHIHGGGAKEARDNRGACQKSMYYDILNGRRNDIELTCKVCNALHCLVELRGLENRWKITYK